MDVLVRFLLLLSSCPVRRGLQELSLSTSNIIGSSASSVTALLLLVPWVLALVNEFYSLAFSLLNTIEDSVRGA